MNMPSLDYEVMTKLQEISIFGEMIHAIRVDCKGEGCDEEETQEVIRSFLQPLTNSLALRIEAAERAKAEAEEYELPD